MHLNSLVNPCTLVQASASVFVSELVILKSHGHRQFNRFVGFFLIKSVNAMFFTENGIYLTISH